MERDWNEERKWGWGNCDDEGDLDKRRIVQYHQKTREITPVPQPNAILVDIGRVMHSKPYLGSKLRPGL